MVGDLESKQLKVAALPSPRKAGLRAGRSKSFPPDRLSPFPKSRIFILRHSFRLEKRQGEELGNELQ
jgi:hypothetical protein